MNLLKEMDRIRASYELFDKLGCCSEDLDGDYSDDAALALIEVDRMRCHIMNCLAALRVVLEQRKIQQMKCLAAFRVVLEQTKIQQNLSILFENEVVKRKVFREACLMMIDTEFDNNKVPVNVILASFPDDSKISDERNWLPLHFAVALFAEDKISAEDVHLLHTNDLLAMYRLSELERGDEEKDKYLIGCTPAHLLCMQQQPKMEMVRHFCICDPKAFLLRDQSGRCTLHLAAEYSESVELLQAMLQIDVTMTKCSLDSDHEMERTPLGLLCGRFEFPTFHEMVACLIGANSSVAVVYDGVMQCFESFSDTVSLDQLIYLSSRCERTMDLLRFLLNANSDVTNYEDSHIFNTASIYLEGEIGVAVLSLLISKNSTGVKVVGYDGYLPIHHAVEYSSLDVLKLLHSNYPESLSILTDHEDNLLHRALQEGSSFSIEDRRSTRDKVEYLCDHCPALIHQKNNEGRTPLHQSLTETYFHIESVICLCSVDETVVRDRFTPPDTDQWCSGQLPLHLLIEHKPPRSELSDEGDCFRLFLRLYPASASIKDDNSQTPYDLAVEQNLSAYFLRLLLSADPTIDSVERHNLNFAARRDGMFLAFRALSANVKPTIWAKIRYEDKNLLARVVSYL
jgi:ankyrin repeat protein